MNFDEYNNFVQQMPRMIRENDDNDITVYLQIIANLIGNHSN